MNSLYKRPFNDLNWRHTPLLLLQCAAVGFTVLGFTVLGCSNDQVKQLTEQVSKQAEQVTKKASETVQQITPQVQDALASGPTGEANFQLDSAVKTQNAFARLLVLKPDRKNVLQLRSYEVESDETFPSFLFQALTDSESIEACVGQSFEGKLFIQTSAEGPTWSTDDAERVTLKITGQAEGELVAEVVGGKLENESGTSSPVKGSLRVAVSKNPAEVQP